ncbi:MAG: hypothetical protein HQL72_11325 [Magnetococcales bacterium]|nr:hypothetical protein [Magnetococcales bacterium]
MKRLLLRPQPRLFLLLIGLTTLLLSPNGLASETGIGPIMVDNPLCRFESNLQQQLTGYYLGMALLTGIGGLMLYLGFFTPSSGKPYLLFAAVAFFSLAVLVVHTLKVKRDWQQFGSVTLTLNSCPAQSGKKMAWQIELPAQTNLTGGLEATVRCQQLYWDSGLLRGDESDSEWREESTTLWQTELSSTEEFAGGSHLFLFTTLLPAQLPGSRQLGPPPISTETEAEKGVQWQIEIRNRGEKNLLHRTYDIPVTSSGL